MPSGWRLVKKEFAASAFDGEGARINSGRWNSVGVAVVYSAQSQSLALLEVLVHLEDRSLLSKYWMGAVHFKESHISRIDERKLPPNWRDEVPPMALQEIGDEWVKERRSVVLRVPSAIVVDEVNYLINPQHPDFNSLQIEQPHPFPVDERLKR